MGAEKGPIRREPRTVCVVCGGDQWDFVRAGFDLCRPDSAQEFRLERCLRCGHIAQCPPPDDDTLTAAYSAGYAPYRPAWKQAGWPLWKILRELTTRRRLWRLRRYPSGGRLLEVGSGAGDFLYAANRAGWDVKAVEYSKDLAEALRNELGFDVRSGELRPGLWEEGQFDLVVLWSVLEHVRDPLETLKTASAYLRAGGAVFIQIPTSHGAELGRSFGQHWELLELPRHLNFFDKRSLAGLCDKAGMDLVVFRTPLLDVAWCYLASSVNYARRSKSALRRQLRLAALAAMVFAALPWLAYKAWRGRGTEAFAVAIKR